MLHKLVVNCTWIWMQIIVGHPVLYLDHAYGRMAQKAIDEQHASGEPLISWADVKRELNL